MTKITLDLDVHDLTVLHRALMREEERLAAGSDEDPIRLSRGAFRVVADDVASLRTRLEAAVERAIRQAGHGAQEVD